MKLRNATVRSRIVELEANFEPICQNYDCGERAEWMVWARHTADCREWVLYHCDGCKTWAVDEWEDVLQHHDPCVCGMVHTGELTDNFRAIKL